MPISWARAMIRVLLQQQANRSSRRACCMWAHDCRVFLNKDSHSLTVSRLSSGLCMLIAFPQSNSVIAQASSAVLPIWKPCVHMHVCLMHQELCHLIADACTDVSLRSCMSMPTPPLLSHWHVHIVLYTWCLIGSSLVKSSIVLCLLCL